MGFLSMMGNSFACSASGERLVSAARDGDLQEARAILEYNPRLARYYSTFGVKNSPLHYSAARGHHEIVQLLLETGVDIDLRNIRGQTALMQACEYGHWEVVQTLMLFNANIHRTDYLNGGTAIHFAALNGHSRCIRLLLADYIPSSLEFLNIMRKRSKNKSFNTEFEESGLCKIVNACADAGITALHMAALNGHTDTVQLLLELGGNVSAVTLEDGTTVDMIGAGSTALHYAACGGNALCCQLLVASGASLVAENANGLTPLMVARSWHRNGLEGVLGKGPESHTQLRSSPYLSLPLMSIMKIAREGIYHTDQSVTALDPCVVCLERKCAVAAEGCNHEFCTRCALYLCSTTTSTSGPPGSIPCPLCRRPIISFFKLPNANPTREMSRMNLTMSLCATGLTVDSECSPSSIQTCKPGFYCTQIPPLSSSLFRSLTCQKCSAGKLNPVLCLGDPEETNRSLVRCSRSRLRRSISQEEGSGRFFNFTQDAITNG